MEHGSPVSGRPLLSRYSLLSRTSLCRSGWKYATALETGLARWRHRPLQRDDAEHAGGFATDRGRVFQARRPVDRPGQSVFLDSWPMKQGSGNHAGGVAGAQNLAIQAQKLYASHHYDHYDFLFMLTDVVGGHGLEHHQSSEDGTRAELLHGLGAERAAAICWRTNTRTPGTGSFGGRRICGRRISTSRCATVCSGCTKGRRNTGASADRALGSCGRRQQARDVCGRRGRITRPVRARLAAAGGHDEPAHHSQRTTRLAG